MKTGPKNLITDVAGFSVGNAADHGIKTGVTVFAADRPFVTGLAVMGGAPGTRETQLLAPDKIVQEIDALVLSGGSAFGLDAPSAVADALRAAGRGYNVAGQRVPIVPGAILFDLANGGDKNWTTNPYKNLGTEAFGALSAQFELGTVGAGVGATAGLLKGGLGSASFQLDNGHTIGALVAVNSIGNVTTGKSHQFWAAPWEIRNEFGGMGIDANRAVLSEPDLSVEPGQATTIAIIATDAELTQAQATRLATSAHDGIARAIVPAHTPYDGDLVFAASNGAKPLVDPLNDPIRLGHAAAICLSRAIARAVFHASPAKNDKLACWSARSS